MEEMSVLLGIELFAIIDYIDCIAIIRTENMGSLTIRNIPDEAKHLFRRRAAANGRSMEEEARQMILAAVAQAQPKRKSIGQMIFDGSRPGFDLPEAPDTPASHAIFDE
jgi:antitoxin FitA